MRIPTITARADPGDGQYYLASAANQVWLQPLGEAMLTDVAFEAPFIKGALAKLDVDPEFIKRAEYKTAPETFTETRLHPGRARDDGKPGQRPDAATGHRYRGQPGDVARRCPRAVRQADR